MRLQRLGHARPQILAIGAGVAAAVSVAACGGGASTPTSTSSPSTTTSSPAPASSGTMPASGAAAVAAVKTSWETFFNAHTPMARRIMLLQNGQTFDKRALQAQASTSMAAGASAKVVKVTVVSPSQAKVTYTVLVNGSPVLTNQSGVAVYQNGTWKVGVASFCALLKLESSGNTASLPAQCRSGG